MTYWLDYWLNRVSMYRLMSVALTVLFLNALLFAAVGILDYSVIAMTVSAGVLVLSTYLFSRLFGYLFGVRPHDESSYITGLILFFLFTPASDPRTLLVLALVGIIAAASKYILAYKGRHIFNPAAIAAVIISLTGLGYASWWVATSSLLFITTITAFLILYKTRRLLMAGVFMTIAVPLVLATLASYGTDLSTSYSLLAAWPFLFFVGYMLSEPLTLPKKKWQVLVEAGIVAILFAVPLHIGAFLITPALALVIGNLFAFIVSRRTSISLTFIERRPLTPTTDEYIFKPVRPASYEPGQYMEITIPHPKKDGRGIRRTFSMTSSPKDTSVRFGVKFYEPSSTYKQALRRLAPGTTLQATTVAGDFTLPTQPSRPLLFIAGGIGITPFISHLRHLTATQQSRKIIVIYSATSQHEIAYADVLHKSGVAVYIVAQSSTALPYKKWIHVNEPTITKELLKKAVPDIANYQVYISGPPAMVSAVKKHAKQLHVSRIHTDYFTGY